MHAATVPALLVLAAITPQPAHAAEPPIPNTVIQHVAGVAKACKEFGGTPAKSPGYMSKADLTGDGQVDYVLDLNLFRCDGAASALASGQMGAGITVFVTGPNNSAIQAFDDVAYGTTIDTASGKPRLYLSVAGAQCGQKIGPNTPFSDYQGCERPIVWNPKTKKFAYAPLSQTRKLGGQAAP